MKKITSIICLLFALTLVFTGCSNDDAPDGFKNVASDREAFYLYVPNAWIDNTSGGTVSAYYSSDDKSNMSFTCLVIDPGDMDELNEYKDITVKELGFLSNFEIIEPAAPAEGETALTIDGRETLIFEYKCTLGEDVYRYKQAVTMKDDFFYIFTYTALEADYEKHLEDVDATIGYIRFK